MRLSRLFASVLFALVVSGLLSACQRAGESDIGRTDDGAMRLGSVEVVDTVARAVDLNDRPLVVEGLRGSVRLTGAEQTTADLSFVHRGRGDSQEDGQSVLEGISITESGTEADYTYTLAADESDYAAVDVQGQVPRQAALRIDRLSGSVDIEGVEGALTVDHEHGAVEVKGAAAPVEVDIKNGDVQVGFQTIPAEGSLLLRTSNGDLDVRLPPGASAEVDAQTNVGDIRTQGLSFSAEQFAPVNAGASYNAQLGTGGPTLELRTENGSIILQAGDTSRADTADAQSSPTVPSTDTTVPAPPDPDTVSADIVTTDTTITDTVTTDTTITDTIRP